MEEKGTKTIIFSLCLCQVIVGIQMLSIAAFFPTYSKTNYGDNMDSTKSSIVMATFDLVGAISNATWHPYTMSKLGKKASIIIGLIVSCIGIVGNGAIAYISNDNWQLFFGLACLSRAVSGWGDSLT